MALKQNTAEGGTDGTAITSGNQTTVGGDKLSLGGATDTISFSASHAAHGTMGYHISHTSGIARTLYWTGYTSTQIAVRSYHYYSVIPSATTSIGAITNSSGTSMNMYINANGTVRLDDSTGVAKYTSSVTLSAATLYRFEASVNTGTTSSNGTINFTAYAGDSTTALFTYTNSALSTGAGATISTVHFGELIASSAVYDDYMDDLAANDGTTTFIGPSVANQAPTADAGPDQTAIPAGAMVTLNGTGSSDPDGTIASYTWTQTAGTTVSLSSSTVASPTFTAPSGSAQTVTFSLVVTDNLGAASTADTVNIGVLAPSNQAPTANAGPDQAGITAAATVTLNGTGSSDPDGTIASYAWTQTAGTTVSLSSSSVASPTFTAPTGSAQTLTFSLVVTDNLGATSSADTVNIGVLAPGTNLKQNSAEGGTNGTAITASTQTGSSSGDQLTRGGTWTTLEFSNAHAAHGSLGYHFVYSSGNPASLYWQGYTSSAMAIRCYRYFLTLPTATTAIMGMYSTGSLIAVAYLSATGTINVNDVSGTTKYTSTSTLSTGTQYRFELVAIPGTTTSNGSINFAAYAADSTTPISTMSMPSAVTTANTGTAAITNVQFGKLLTNSSTHDDYLDDLAASDGATTFIGPYSSSNQAPTANAGLDQTGIVAGTPVTLNGTGSSDSDGTIASYAWTQTAGTTVSLSNSSVASPTFTAPSASAQTLTFSLTVTDNLGATSTADTVNIGVLAPASNQAPTANAGPDQTGVPNGVTVTLNGTGSSDSDGTIASYAWTQTAGTTVMLSSSSVASPTFTAPTASAQTLTFSLVVTDNFGASSSADTVNIFTTGLAPILKQNGAEGGTDGMAITASNQTGGASGDQLTVGGSTDTISFSSAHPAHGSMGYKIDHTSGHPRSLYWGGYTATQMAMRSYQYFSAIPSSTTNIMAMSNGGGTALYVYINPSGTIRVDDSSGVAKFTSTATLSAATMYRLEAAVDVGTTTSNGTIRFAVYAGDSTTALATYSSFTLNTGAGATISTVQFGQFITSTATYDVYLDDLAAQTGTTTFIGPYSVSNQPPTASAGSNQTNIEPYTTGTLTGTDSDSDGTVASRAWTQTAGSPTVSLSGAATATATYVAPGTIAGTTLTFGYQVIDNGGSSSTQSTVTNVILPVTERAVIAGAEVPMKPLAVSGGMGALEQTWSPLSGTLRRRGHSTQPANYNQIGVIGDSLTKMNSSGVTLITSQLTALGWNANDVQVLGVYGMKIAATSGTPSNSTGNIISTWRAGGFDPRVWVFATGINDQFAGSAPYDSIRQAAVQQIYSQIMAGPQSNYVVYWIGFDFYDTAYSREPEATAFDQTLAGFQSTYSNFHACSIKNYYAPLRSNPNWSSWWDYPTDEVHNTDLGYQTIRAPFYGQCVAAEAP